LNYCHTSFIPHPATAIAAQVEFLIAGTLTITIIEGKRLRKTAKAVGRQDPYVILKLDGRPSGGGGGCGISGNAQHYLKCGSGIRHHQKFAHHVIFLLLACFDC